MNLYALIAMLLTLTALFSFLNHLYLKLPTVIGVMLISLALSLAILFLDVEWFATAAQLVSGLDFKATLMNGVLCYLLFAGALFVNLGDLVREKWLVGCLATVGLAISTLLTAGLIWGLSAWLGFPLPLLYCLLFGALISPTDPVAVLAILRQAGLDPAIRTRITGESLFNDGVSVVLFATLLSLVAGGPDEAPASVVSVVLLFLQEVAGGALAGLLLGAAGYQLLRRVDEHAIEILITLAVVSGGYSLCQALHVSGPIAMVVAGLMIGNHGKMLAMSAPSREHLDNFWELVDEILNSVLFVLLGLELLIIAFTPQYLLAGVIAIAVTLAARLLSVSLPMAVFSWKKRQPVGAEIRLLTWGGSRGGISVALALSLPPTEHQGLLLAMTYCVVVWSIVVQGLSIGRLAARRG